MAIAGLGGSVKVGAAPAKVGEVNQWKLDIGADVVDVTSFDSNGWKEHIATLKDWSGSFDANWDVENDTPGQGAVQNALFAGTTLQVEFDVDATHKYSGTIIVSKASITSAVKDEIKVAYTFQGTGQLTYA